MIIHLFGLVIFIYVFIRLIRPLPLRWWFKSTYAAIAFLASQVHLIQKLLPGGLAAPEIPGWVIMSMGWAFASLLVLACSLLLRDLLLLMSFGFNPRIRQAILSPLNTSFMLMFSTFICAVGVWRAVSFPNVTQFTLEFDNLPPAFDGYRIVHLTDLHASRLLPESWISEVVKMSSSLRPDLILITGDIVDGTPEARRRDIRALKLLDAADGVYASLGNHEYYSGIEGWLQAFDDINLPILLNEHVRIQHGSDSIVIAGITDPAATRFNHVAPDIEEALAGVEKEELVILLSHRPQDADRHAQHGVDLQLSGHTHGGQIMILNVFTKLANNGFLMGLYKVNNMYLYQNRGAGLWGGLPVRIGVESEIAEITLRRKN